MPPELRAVIGSNELGLPSGSWDQLDESLRALDRERTVLVIVALMNLYSVRKEERRGPDVSAWFAQLLPQPQRSTLEAALGAGGNIFIEPFQLLVVLKRAMSVCVRHEVGQMPPADAMIRVFDACRFATDIVNAQAPEDTEDNDPDAWLKVAAGMMPRLGMLNPPNIASAIARFNIMTDATNDPHLGDHLAALNGRFPEAFDGLSFSEVTAIVRFIAVWSVRKEVTNAGSSPQIVRFNPETFFRHTTIGSDKLRRFIDRTALPISTDLSGSAGVSPVRFRDRPLISFSDGGVAPVLPPFLAEKLTADLFWWLKTMGEDQRRAWQADWGYVVESYAIRKLRAMADSSGVGFKARIVLENGELDAALWADGHIALFEVTSSLLRENEVISGDWRLLGDGLRRTLVEGAGGYKEAGAQLVRDIEGLLRGIVDIPHGEVRRIYPVIISAERNVRTPGVVHFLQKEFVGRLRPEDAQRCAGLAVLGLEDLETAETLCLSGRTGALDLFRRWDSDRGLAPSWWQFIEVIFGDVPPNAEIEAAIAKWRATIRDEFGRPE